MLDKDDSMGYGSLEDAVAIEFDFHITLDEDNPAYTDPGQPHLSVQYSYPLESDSSKSLGMAWLPYDLTKGGQHTVKVEYVRALEEETYFGDITFSTYAESFLDFTGTTTWYDSKIGLLKVFIDDMDRSLLEIPINLGAIVGHDDLSSPNPDTGNYDGSMACKSWITFTGSTSETTDQSAAFQILQWLYTSHEKCRMTSAECLKARDLSGTRILKNLRVRNIGHEKLYLKFIYKNVTSYEYTLDQEYWTE